MRSDYVHSPRSRTQSSLGISDDKRMAQFHTTVLTLLHGSAKEAYEVAAKEAATERRTELAEQETETWFSTRDEPTADAREAKKKTYFDETPEFIEEDFEVGLTAICDQLLPFQALIKVKRYLRRHCHKPASMTIRQYVSRIRKINEHELPLLVPMSPDNQELPFDEVKELLFYGIPNRYRKKLQEMDVDMTNCPDYATFIQRAERVEEAERMDSNSNTCRDSSIAWDLPFSLYFNISNLKHYTFLCKYTKEQLTLSHYNSTQYTVTQLDSSSNNKRNSHSNTLN